MKSKKTSELPVRLCVFCGSSLGTHPRFKEIARELGQKLVEQGFGLVYGGASVGLMGTVADAVLALQGEVIGVMPQSLFDLEVAHKNLNELIIVETMHERKQKLYDYSDGFVAMPGGPGTMDEWFEILTWAQLKYHKKPIYILNPKIEGEGYFDPLVMQLDRILKYGFMKAEQKNLFKVVSEVDELLLSFKEKTKIP